MMNPTGRVTRHLAALVQGQDQSAINASRLLPVALKCVEFTNPNGSKSIGHVLINRYGKVIGHPATENTVKVTDGIPKFGCPLDMRKRFGHTDEQVLSVSTYALMQLMPLHPVSLAAVQDVNVMQGVGDNIGRLDIPLVFPHLLPKTVGMGADDYPEAGLETASGLFGYLDRLETALNVTAGELAYAANLEPMLALLEECVMNRNGYWEQSGNVFRQYMHRGLHG